MGVFYFSYNSSDHATIRYNKYRTYPISESTTVTGTASTTEQMTSDMTNKVINEELMLNEDILDILTFEENSSNA